MSIARLTFDAASARSTAAIVPRTICVPTSTTRRFSRRVAGHQVHQQAVGPTAKILDERLGVLGRPLRRHDGDDQLARRSQRHVVLAVPLAVAGRVGSIAVGLLLGDESPLLIELDLGRKGGNRHEFVVGGPVR
jgi:hypothetical protein